MKKATKKAEPKPYRFVIDEPVYMSSCTFFVGYPYALIEREIKAKATPESIKDFTWYSGVNGCAFCFNLKDSGASCFVIYLKNYSTWTRHKAILGHELVHLIFQIFNNKGVPVRQGNDEAFAYLFEYYFNAVLTELAKKYF